MISLGFRQLPNGLKKSINFVPRRNFNIFEFNRKRSEAYYKKIDKIDDTYVMVYRAPMEGAMPFCNLLTVIGAGIFGYYVYDRYKNRFIPLSSVQEQSPLFHRGTVIMADDEIIYAVIGMVVICSMIKSFVWKYPLRIYRNANK
jgi:hypothetical protein